MGCGCKVKLAALEKRVEYLCGVIEGYTNKPLGSVSEEDWQTARTLMAAGDDNFLLPE